jgi:hypothetical protein
VGEIATEMGEPQVSPSQGVLRCALMSFTDHAVERSFSPPVFVFGILNHVFSILNYMYLTFRDCDCYHIHHILDY